MCPAVSSIDMVRIYVYRGNFVSHLKLGKYFICKIYLKPTLIFYYTMNFTSSNTNKMKITFLIDYSFNIT